ncbi:hypothetical protein N9A81_01185 [Synechococcus sp. AH-707-M23]|nr:hypothetical protein [Synechococcus sp. AH-707-M23]
MKFNQCSLLLILPLSLGVTGCSWGKYPSKIEAENKCKEWSANGRLLRYQRGITEEEELEKLKKSSTEPLTSPDIRLMRLARYSYDLREGLGEKTYSVREKVWDKINARRCELELETNQYLGYENQLIKDGTYKAEFGKRGEAVVVKHFRF